MYGIPICYTSMCVSTVLKRNCVLQDPTVNLKYLFCLPLCAENSEHCQPSAGRTVWSMCAVLYQTKSLIFTSVSLIVSGLVRERGLTFRQSRSSQCSCSLNVVMSCYDNVEGIKLLVMQCCYDRLLLYSSCTVFQLY